MITTWSYSKTIYGTDHKKKVFSSWVPWCVFYLVLFKNDFGHWSQEKSFFPVESLYESSTWSYSKMSLDTHKKFFISWVPLWVFNMVLLKNDLGHWSQEKRFFPVQSLYEFSTWSYSKMIFGTDHKKKNYPVESLEVSSTWSY